jgi:hypothetical protein
MAACCREPHPSVHGQTALRPTPNTKEILCPTFTSLLLPISPPIHKPTHLLYRSHSFISVCTILPVTHFNHFFRLASLFFLTDSTQRFLISLKRKRAERNQKCVFRLLLRLHSPLLLLRSRRRALSASLWAPRRATALASSRPTTRPILRPLLLRRRPRL